MTPQYWASGIPELGPFGDLVAAWRGAWEYDFWLQKKGGLEMLQNIYADYGLYVVGYSLPVHESLVGRTPISGIKDFKGIKMRAPEGMIADFFTKLGALVRKISATQALEALEAGNVGIADYSTLGNNYKQGWYKTAKHTIFPGFHSMVLIDFVVNKERWDELPPHNK